MRWPALATGVVRRPTHIARKRVEQTRIVRVCSTPRGRVPQREISNERAAYVRVDLIIIEAARLLTRQVVANPIVCIGRSCVTSMHI